MVSKLMGGSPKVDTSAQEAALKAQEKAQADRDSQDQQTAAADLARKRARRAGGASSLVTSGDTGVVADGTRASLG